MQTNTMEIEVVKTIEQYQLLINQVRETKTPIKVKVDMNHPELDKAMDKLDLDGVDIIISGECDLIKPI